MKLTGDIVQCDRCGRRALPSQAKEPGSYEPREYSLRDLALNGGPVLDLCRFCRQAVEDFARGHDLPADVRKQMSALAIENVELAAKLRLAAEEEK
jgi:hypothetical protein